jgi:protein-arginine kinase activator protein McsA
MEATKLLQIKKKNYNDYLNKGSIGALLKLLREFEEQEEFEECIVIRDTIKEFNELCKDNLPTRL